VIWLVDISRLVENLHLSTPTGIDRVEMAYVQHFLKRAGDEDVRFVITWPHFTAILQPGEVRPLIDELAARWAVQGRAVDTAFAELRVILARPTTSMNGSHALRIGGGEIRTGAAAWARTAAMLVRSMGRRLSRGDVEKFRQAGACYIHVSQFRLHRPERFAWLEAAAARAIFFLHDLIPVAYPEYCRPGEAQRHARRVDTMTRHASAVIANSAFTRGQLEAHQANIGHPIPRCEVVPLGLSDIFLDPPDVAPVTVETPYFVAIGTIEPRKNLTFLLQAWHRWTKAGAAPRARLVIVGRRGWENESVVDLLDRSPALAPSVVEVASLGDQGMVALLKGALALLAPSLVEGFGLPVAEALALGVPVIASDIAAHREVGGPFVDYVSPLNGPGWIAALDACMAASRPRGLTCYRPTAWPDHMAKVDEILRSLCHSPSPRLPGRVRTRPWAG
jgi:glycosyltransferase involved in cell wall biosynthesis